MWRYGGRSEGICAGQRGQGLGWSYPHRHDCTCTRDLRVSHSRRLGGGAKHIAGAVSFPPLPLTQYCALPTATAHCLVPANDGHVRAPLTHRRYHPRVHPRQHAFHNDSSQRHRALPHAVVGLHKGINGVQALLRASCIPMVRYRMPSMRTAHLQQHCMHPSPAISPSMGGSLHRTLMGMPIAVARVL